MSLHFIIDGYNLIKQARFLDNPSFSLEESRRALIEFLKLQRPQGSPNNKVTIVFDGRKDEVFSSCSYAGPGLKVIFSQGRSADDKIKDMLEESPLPVNIVVVTNDREIRSFAAGRRARVMAVDEFLNKALKTKNDVLGKDVLLPADAANITEEMKQIWLKK